MRGVWLILTGLAAMIVTIFLQFPLRTAMQLGGAEESGLSWRWASGTVWNGGIDALQGNDLPAMDVALKASPLNIFTLRYRAALTFSGAVRGTAGATVRPDQSIVLRDASLVTDIGSLGVRDLFGKPMTGLFRIETDEVILNARGCQAGTFRVETDALRQSARHYGGTGFVLAGQGRCDSGEIVLSLTGEGEDGRAEISLTVSALLDYTADVRIQSSVEQLRYGLLIYGFEEQSNGMLVLTQRGNAGKDL